MFFYFWHEGFLNIWLLPEPRFFALSLLPGHRPAHFDIDASEGKRDISDPMTLIIAWALVCPMPVT